MTTRIIHLRDARFRPAEAPAGRPARLGERILAFLLRRDRRRRERYRLAELDERVLRDVGLTRAQVEAELRRTSRWWTSPFGS